MYTEDDWRALSIRAAQKQPERPILRFARPLLIGGAIFLTGWGFLNLFGFMA